jgi:hypothetical protein
VCDTKIPHLLFGARVQGDVYISDRYVHVVVGRIAPPKQKSRVRAQLLPNQNDESDHFFLNRMSVALYRARRRVILTH